MDSPRRPSWCTASRSCPCSTLFACPLSDPSCRSRWNQTSWVNESIVLSLLNQMRDTFFFLQASCSPLWRRWRTSALSSHPSCSTVFTRWLDPSSVDSSLKWRPHSFSSPSPSWGLYRSLIDFFEGTKSAVLLHIDESDFHVSDWWP